jgi:hypothetical protein
VHKAFPLTGSSKQSSLIAAPAFAVGPPHLQLHTIHRGWHAVGYLLLTPQVTGKCWRASSWLAAVAAAAVLPGWCFSPSSLHQQPNSAKNGRKAAWHHSWVRLCRSHPQMV